MVTPPTPDFWALEHFVINDTRLTVSLILFQIQEDRLPAGPGKLVRESDSVWLFPSVASLGTKILAGHCNMSGGKWRVCMSSDSHVQSQKGMQVTAKEADMNPPPDPGSPGLGKQVGGEDSNRKWDCEEIILFILFRSKIFCDLPGQRKVVI